MRKEEVFPAGFKVYDDNDNLIGYMPDNYGEGRVYKNENAFYDDKDDICYISEHAFDDYEDEMIPVSDAKNEGETYNTIFGQVKDAWGEDYMLTDEQVAHLVTDVFYLADWAYISTYLEENFEIEDNILDNEDVFTPFQRDAVENEMTPKEYADRQLSYDELIEFDREFNDAFVVDEDCEDDWSDNGLGTNARLTYIDERKRGIIYGPDEFDCDVKWRKK